ncbi:hypothetical protein VHUM_00632 [Vanrija humicola]|uniref:Arsenite methyltransferase n=1 Tax=Vanrija humicola TaxID=5417 RepID=A0A7D8V1I0_VANHU|nr:hypothetical protein VHUM_00632 [Vanrija humicola]
MTWAAVQKAAWELRLRASNKQHSIHRLTSNGYVPHATHAPLTPASTTHTLVRDKYATAVTASVGKASCCGSKATVLEGVDPITKDLYSADEAAEVPADALLASFGCGNPTALAKLEPGQVVLDLGSGGGIDVLLSARRVGPTGKAYGLDMTPEMIELARKNAAAAGAKNVEFLLGTIEAIPLPDNSVDVIISNCVINLAPNKDDVLAEAFRVLKPGGQFAVSDIVLARALPEGLRRNIELWAGCISGALIEEEYEEKLANAGFTAIDIEPTRVYSSDDAGEFATSGAATEEEKKEQLAALDGAVFSAFIRGTKL